jgi:hypothetical protein
MASQTNPAHQEATQMNTNIRTIIVSLIAAGSFATATIAPVAAQADSPSDLEKAGYNCEVVHNPTEISCSNGLHLFSCSLTECVQIYRKAPPVGTKPPVITKVTSPVTTLKLAL